MMNGHPSHRARQCGSYSGSRAISRSDQPSILPSDTRAVQSRHSFSPPCQENTHLPWRNSVQPPSSTLSNVPPRSDAQQKVTTDGEASSTAYYNHVHAQVRLNTSNHRSRQGTDQSKSVEPTIDSPASILPSKPISQPTFSNETDPPLDYGLYTMDHLIEQLVPTSTYLPKQSFLHPMLLCSRMNIRPNLLLNRLARSTFQSLGSYTREQSSRTRRNLLQIVSFWTRALPNDFRNQDTCSELEAIFQQITSNSSTLQSTIDQINEKLQTKLQGLRNYEEHLRQLNHRAAKNLPRSALRTDILHECPSSTLFAQQLTHIELDRLKPIGAEELIQYYMMKFASEEARVQSDESLQDKKSTVCLEAYIQWFNRLTSFVTTEVLKHTQRRSRVRLIDYFLDAAEQCLLLHNFNSMAAILGGLNMQPVRRLRKTWEKNASDRLQQLDEHLNVSKNFLNYRSLLKEALDDAQTHQWAANKIVIPFTSLVLQDVYFIKTHSKDYTAEGGINLRKYYSMATCITDEFVQFKQSKFSLERNEMIINYIITSPTFDEDALLLASFECEPAVTPYEKEKWERLRPK